MHTELGLANEICETYADLATLARPMVRAGTVVAALPMQELAFNEWLLRRLESVDIHTRTLGLQAGLDDHSQRTFNRLPRSSACWHRLAAGDSRSLTD